MGMKKPLRSVGREARRRSGFTLLELLLVTVILAILMAMAVPTFRGTLAGQQLRQAGSLVAGGLSKARVTAIRSGTPQQFCYQADGSAYWVQPFDSTSATTGTPGAAGTAAAPAPMASVSGELPQGITFTSGIGVVAGGAASAAPTAATNGNRSVGSVQETVTFFPDGSSHDVTLMLSNGRGRAVTVHVRGLTGLTQLGDLQAVAAQP
jgi:prepilin-type N-terminal cleavage/methylation domain-containing protein